MEFWLQSRLSNSRLFYEPEICKKNQKISWLKYDFLKKNLIWHCKISACYLFTLSFVNSLSRTLTLHDSHLALTWICYLCFFFLLFALHSTLITWQFLEKIIWMFDSFWINIFQLDLCFCGICMQWSDFHTDINI